MNNKEKKLKKIADIYSGNINDLNDLLAGREPSTLFFITANCLKFLIKDNPEEVLSYRGMKIRNILNKVVMKIGKNLLTYQQVFVPRSELLEGAEDFSFNKDEKPVIWASNHGYKDDAFAMILSVKRHAYILFGSLPIFLNTLDGLTAFLNGIVLLNRKNMHSRHTSKDKAIKVLEMGKDLVIFPEGCWNRTPNQLMIDLWPGIYRIASKTGSKVIPVIQYIRDPLDHSEVIYTTYGNPISFDGLSEEDGMQLLRDEMATWLWLLIEKYGKTTHEELLNGFNTPSEAWDAHISQLNATVTEFWDIDIELKGDYRPKSKVRPETVWKPIADIKHITTANASSVSYANKVVLEESENDYLRKPLLDDYIKAFGKSNYDRYSKKH